MLVADDERNIVQLASLYLGNEGYRVETAANGREALDKVARRRPMLVVLDLMMPELDGWEVCKQLRRASDVPIIMLTARGDDVDKVVGLELGADDYITKPFNPRELVARVKAVLRRYEVGREPMRPLHFADISVDQARREFKIGGRTVDLRPKEFELRATLAGSPGVVFQRERLLQVVLGLRLLWRLAHDRRACNVAPRKARREPGPDPNGLGHRLQACSR